MAWRNLRRNSKRTIFIVLSMILCIILLNSANAIGNSVDVKKYVSSVTSFDFVVASPNTFSNVQGFRFKDDSVSNEIISDIENNIPVLNGSRIYKNTLDDVSVTYDYGSLVTEVLDEYTEDNHLIRSGMVDGRTYPVKLGVDYRPLCNIYGVIACHERLRLWAVYLVHRVAGYQVDAHGVFQRFVQIGVESQDRGIFQRFRFVQIKALNLARL